MLYSKVFNQLNFKKILTFTLTILFSQVADAADRIGNGGGVWACEIGKNIYSDLMFIDVYEARRERLLEVPETSLNYLEYLSEKINWVNRNLPDYKMNSHFQYVLKNVIWIEEVLTTIPDMSNVVSPHPSTCKNGEWSAVQLVNFTNDFRILIRKDLFNSNMLTEMERAAVYIHESIYSFMRTEFNDTNSLRARAITGYILSNRSDIEIVQAIKKIISSKTPEPEPPKNQGWTCGIKPESRSNLYVQDDRNIETAKKRVFDDCVNGETESMCPPGFPCFPVPNKCKMDLILCEPYVSTAPKVRCDFYDFFDKLIASAADKNNLSARKSLIKECLIKGFDTSTCFDTDKVICDSLRL